MIGRVAETRGMRRQDVLVFSAKSSAGRGPMGWAVTGSKDEAFLCNQGAGQKGGGEENCLRGVKMAGQSGATKQSGCGRSSSRRRHRRGREQTSVLWGLILAREKRSKAMPLSFLRGREASQGERPRVRLSVGGGSDVATRGPCALRHAPSSCTWALPRRHRIGQRLRARGAE